MKRILVVLECDLSLTTGYSINERESLIALLDRYPDDVVAIAPSPANPQQFSDSRIRYLSNHRRHNPIRYAWFLFSAYLEIRRLTRETRVDAVAFRLGAWPILPVLTNKLLKVPVFIKTLSGYAIYERRDRRPLFALLSVLTRSTFAAALNGCVGADSPSTALRQWLEYAHPSLVGKVEVIPNGVNVEQFAPAENAFDKFNLRPDAIVIGYVGALDTLRNLETAIRAMRTLVLGDPFVLLIVGSGPNEHHLRSLAREYGVLDSVIFGGFQPYHEIPKIMSCFDVAFDLTAVPLSFDNNTIIGSYSQKIPQYLACGRPVIVAECDDSSYVRAAGVGIAVRPDDAEAFVCAVRLLIEDGTAGNVSISRLRSFAIDKFGYRKLAAMRMNYWANQLAKLDSNADQSE